MRYISSASSDPGSEYREEVNVPGRQDFNPVHRSAYLVWWHCSHYLNFSFRESPCLTRISTTSSKLMLLPAILPAQRQSIQPFWSPKPWRKREVLRIRFFRFWKTVELPSAL